MLFRFRDVEELNWWTHSYRVDLLRWIDISIDGGDMGFRILKANLAADTVFDVGFLSGFGEPELWNHFYNVDGEQVIPSIL